MRRILLVLSVALILTLMLTAPAGAKNGALVIHDPEDCTIDGTQATRCQAVGTPSGRENAHAHLDLQQ